MKHRHLLDQFDDFSRQLSRHQAEIRTRIFQVAIPVLVAFFGILFFVYQARSAQMEQQTGELYNNILEWLTPLDFAQMHQAILSSRSPGTGSWLIQDDNYASWAIAGKNQTLWLQGIPGAGKTVLASIAVDNLRRKSNTADVAVSYIYCDYKDEAQQTPENIVGVIIKDVVRKQPLSAGLVEFYKDHKKANIRPTLPGLVRILRVEAGKLSSGFIVVDAVDELTDNNRSRKTLLEILSDLVPYLNVMVTSRPHVNVTKRLPNVKSIQVAATSQDIRRYAENRLSSPRFKALVKGSPDLPNRIVQMVDSKSKDMLVAPALVKPSCFVTCLLRSSSTRLVTETNRLLGFY